MKKNTLNKHEEEDWNFALDFFNDKCAYCNNFLYYDYIPEKYSNIANNQLTMDHIIPLSNGGSYTPGNIIPSCKSCNASKSNQKLIPWYANQSFFNLNNLSKIIDYLITINDRIIMREKTNDQKSA